MLKSRGSITQVIDLLSREKVCKVAKVVKESIGAQDLIEEIADQSQNQVSNHKAEELQTQRVTRKGNTFQDIVL